MRIDTGCSFCGKEKGDHFWITLETESYLNVEITIDGEKFSKYGGDLDFCSLHCLSSWFTNLSGKFLKEKIEAVKE